jgi:hypothetical protein
MDIDKLKALALAATPGPWEWWTSNSTLRLTGADGKDGGVLYGYVHSGVGDVSCSDASRAFIEASNPATVLELIAEVEKLQARFEYIGEHATTHGGGHGFTVSFFVPVDCEDIGCGIDAAIAAHTKAGKEPA